MMQLTYLTFTAPRKDNEAFESYKNRMKAELQNADANPMTAFSDTVSYALYGNHPRSFSMKENMVDKIDYDRVMEMYKDRFKDASDFTFYFVGNIDVEKMKPMIAKYLGGLPSINRKETFKDTKMEIRKGQYKNEFAKKQETPMATISCFRLYSRPIRPRKTNYRASSSNSWKKWPKKVRLPNTCRRSKSIC